MQCPKCHSGALQPTKLEHGLSAMGCNTCEGALVALLYYRDWVERTPLDLQQPQDDQESSTPLQALIGTTEETNSAMSCPKCTRLMLKFRISGESDNKLDLCSFCDEAWLDKGEWQLLKMLELNRKMPLVFSEQWQTKLRKQATQDARDNRLLQYVTETELAKAKEFKQWVSEHPNKERLLFYVNQN
ncbi:MAG: zf-TFIIB domain-containing protein [Kangiellaceae bacterium]|nr:zf-TFIIB domain-containing protein [Kangiellaceae bacterium]